MPSENFTKSFESGTELEVAFIELKTLVQSYVDLSGDEITSLVFTLDHAIDRFDVALKAHLSVLHEAVK